VIESAKEFLSTRGQAYQNTFSGIYGERVVTDLAKFCRAKETTFHPDPRVEAVMQGRREVWLRIAAHLNLSEKDLWTHFNPGQGV
jgi:hypothetical protein